MTSDRFEAGPDRPTRNWWLWGSLALGGLIVLGLLFSGETDHPSGPGDGGHMLAPDDRELPRNLFDSAADILNRLEQFDTDPALRLVLDRLNQWIGYDEPTEPWELDPLVATLPEEPADLKKLAGAESAGGLKFLPEDGNHLLETNWLRNIARNARGEHSDDLSRAQRLFDWTVRNIQLEDWSYREGRQVTYRPAMLEGKDKQHDISFLARDAMLFGRGDYVHRAWVFMLLARQENLDVVLLAVPDKDGAHGWRPWLPALVHQDGLYLFDTYLGLPIPGPDKRPATLAQVLANPQLLAALDLPNQPYPLEAAGLKEVIVLVEGSPAYLTRRMQAVDRRLAGDKKVVLAAYPAAIAEKLKGMPGVADVRLWPQPFEAQHDRQSATPQQIQTIRRNMAPFMIRYPTPRMHGRSVTLQDEHPLFMGQPQSVQQMVDQSPLEYQWCSLWMGRTMHFKGAYTSSGNREGALGNYLEVMVKDTEVDDWINKFLRAAGPLDEARTADFRATMREVIPLAKQTATYWLGLIAFDRGNYATCTDFLNRSLAASSNSPWEYGAAYNLARNYEEQAAQTKDPAEADQLRKQAIKLLEEDQSPQSLGNRLRAKSLKAKLTKPSQTEQPPAGEQKSSGERGA